MNWAEVDARWPHASVAWDREVEPEGWAPDLRDLADGLWAIGPGCTLEEPARDGWICVGGKLTHGETCRCRNWDGGHWIDRSEYGRRLAERREDYYRRFCEAALAGMLQLTTDE